MHRTRGQWPGLPWVMLRTRGQWPGLPWIMLRTAVHSSGARFPVSDPGPGLSSNFKNPGSPSFRLPSITIEPLEVGKSQFQLSAPCTFFRLSSTSNPSKSSDFDKFCRYVHTVFGRNRLFSTNFVGICIRFSVEIVQKSSIFDKVCRYMHMVFGRNRSKLIV